MSWFERTFPNRSEEPMLDVVRERILAHVNLTSSRRRRLDDDDSAPSGSGREVQ